MSESTQLTVDVYDQREQEHRHATEKLKIQQEAETKRARINRSEARMSALVMIVGILAVAAVVVLAGLWIWSETNGPESNEPTGDERREIACVDNGGVWVPDDLLTSGDPLCVYPGKKVPEPAGE